MAFHVKLNFKQEVNKYVKHEKQLALITFSQKINWSAKFASEWTSFAVNTNVNGGLNFLYNGPVLHDGRSW